jgi:hypothetical protein
VAHLLGCRRRHGRSLNRHLADLLHLRLRLAASFDRHLADLLHLRLRLGASFDRHLADLLHLRRAGPFDRHRAALGGRGGRRVVVRGQWVGPEVLRDQAPAVRVGAHFERSLCGSRGAA